ncbi:MAG: chemotaxis protein CheW, partial [Myxococcota bacterium]
LSNLANGERSVAVDGRVLPAFSLEQMIGLECGTSTEDVGLLVDTPGGDVVYCVHAVIGQEELVVKALGEPLRSIPWLAGSSLLPDGRAAFLVDLRALWLHGMEPRRGRPTANDSAFVVPPA